MTLHLDNRHTAQQRTAANPGPGVERMTGLDAMFWHLERPDTPLHTLKVVVLDSSRCPKPVDLEQIAGVLPDYLGLVERTTQKVVVAPGFGGRPFWVDDEDFDLTRHLDERRVAAPGGRAELDALCAELAVEQLDRSRPLWALTLVHGLADGRQAVVVRVHHAVMDGVAALNTFLAATSSRPGEKPAVAPPRPAAGVDESALWAPAVQDLRGWGARAARVLRSGRASRQVTRAFGSTTEIPRGLAHRTSLNTPSGDRRSCASETLDLVEMKRLARAAGTTLNGALHGVVAEALRDHLADRGEATDRPLVAIFGVAEDAASDRRQGNGIATARAYLRTDLEDPADRLRATARSCLLAVDLRRRRGFELNRSTADLTGRVAPTVRAGVAHISPGVANHITTANVAGPDHRRWLGNHEVVDWISYAVAIAPSDVNLTAYTYDGRFTIGLVVTPESMPDPRGFLDRLQPALSALLAAVEPQADGTAA